VSWYGWAGAFPVADKYWTTLCSGSHPSCTLVRAIGASTGTDWVFWNDPTECSKRLVGSEAQTNAPPCAFAPEDRFNHHGFIPIYSQQ